MSKITLVKSFVKALNGILDTIIKERNLKIQIVIGLIAISLSVSLKVQKIYLILIIFVSFLVIILELLNAVVERLIDVISPRYNSKIGGIKDTMAGVVLVSAVLSVITGLLILYKPLISVIKINDLFILPVILSISIIVFTGYIIKYLRKLK